MGKGLNGLNEFGLKAPGDKLFKVPGSKFKVMNPETRNLEPGTKYIS
jgi:hypothetical protein